MTPPNRIRTSRGSIENDDPASSGPLDGVHRRPLLRAVGAAGALGLTGAVASQRARAEHDTDPCDVDIDFNRSKVARVFGAADAGITSLTVFYFDTDGRARKQEGVDPTTDDEYGDVPLRVRYARGRDMTVIQIGRKHTSLRRVVAIGPDCRSGATNSHGPAAGENDEPIADFEWTPDPGVTGEPVSFTSSATDPDGELVHHGWDFDGDGAEDATGESATHTFTTAGEHDVTLTVVDDFDATDSITRTVVVNRPPTADFEWTPATIHPGDPVTFTSTSTDVDGELVHHGWDFDGDGAEDATGESATHTFGVPGEHDVTLAVVDDLGATDSATETVSVDPPWQQTTKLVGSDTVADDDYGDAVAIDGDTVVVGAPSEDENGGGAGAAYVFTRSGGTWSQQAKLTPADAASGDNFGEAVALDGDTAVVGAPRKIGSRIDQGAAYVFARSGGTWSQQRTLVPDGGGRARFGESVAVDGDTVAVGAPVEDLTFSGIERGAAYVFTRSAGAWSRQQKLVADAPSDHDHFGNAVALDGDTALVAARGATFNSNTGKAYVFARSGGTWSQRQTLLGADVQSQDNFGWSVDLDGTTAIVGATPDSESRAGAGYVFVRTGGSWAQQAHLLAADRQDGDRFGAAVTVDSETAFVGASREDANGADAGAAYAFTRSGSTWTERQKLLAGDGERLDNFGRAVDLDGDTLVVGAQPSHTGADDPGGAYVFVDTR